MAAGTDAAITIWRQCSTHTTNNPGCAALRQLDCRHAAVGVSHTQSTRLNAPATAQKGAYTPRLSCSMQAHQHSPMPPPPWGGAGHGVRGPLTIFLSRVLEAALGSTQWQLRKLWIGTKGSGNPDQCPMQKTCNACSFSTVCDWLLWQATHSYSETNNQPTPTPHGHNLCP